MDNERIFKIKDMMNNEMSTFDVEMNSVSIYTQFRPINSIWIFMMIPADGWCIPSDRELIFEN